MHHKTQDQSILLSLYGQLYIVILEPPFSCQTREIRTYAIANAEKNSIDY